MEGANWGQRQERGSQPLCTQHWEVGRGQEGAQARRRGRRPYASAPRRALGVPHRQKETGVRSPPQAEGPHRHASLPVPFCCTSLPLYLPLLDSPSRSNGGAVEERCGPSHLTRPRPSRPLPPAPHLRHPSCPPRSAPGCAARAATTALPAPSPGPARHVACSRRRTCRRWQQQPP